MTRKPKRKSDLPVGTQFSPDLIDLPQFLKAIIRHSGDREAMLNAVWEPSVRRRAPKRPPTTRQKSLPLEAARQYELLDGQYGATELARSLAGMPRDQLLRMFARHLLLNLGGLTIVQAVEEMRLDPSQPSVTSDPLARYLTEHRGFRVIEHNTAINTFRMWLAEAGVFPKVGRSAGAWIPNKPQVEALIGMSEQLVNAVAALAPHQVAFIDALCAVGDRKAHRAADIRALAETRNPGVRFNRASLPSDVLAPLRDMGLVTYTTTGTGGGKSSLVTVTERFDTEVLDVFLKRTLQHLDPIAAAYFSKVPDEIYRDLRSKDSATKGRALEALAIRVMRLLGLRFVGWNRRAVDTGYGEVDALLKGVLGAVPVRLQIQCKNTTATIGHEDVAREVGLTVSTGASHILFLANSRFTRNALRFADEVMRRTPLTLYLLDKDDFERLEEDDSNLGTILREKADLALEAAVAGTAFDSSRRRS